MNNRDMLAVKGNIIHTPSRQKFESYPNHYLLMQAGRVKEIIKELPSEQNFAKVEDYGDCLIVPGLMDIHTHAPQFAFRGIGMDLELLPWLEAYPFKEEARYEDQDYAKEAYGRFVNHMNKGATTRACVFATIHRETTKWLMEHLEASGLITYVGKVNMDRHSPKNLQESTQDACFQTEAWLKSSFAYQRTKPIITPRFVPSCTEELMAFLGGLAEKYKVPIQSHLSENQDEVRWVSELHPSLPHYAGVYDHFQLFGSVSPTIMAHCVYCTEAEIELMAQRGVYVAHCPQSNTNLASGIAPIAKLMRKGIPIGLGTDVAGGFSASIFRAMSDAIQVSKLRKVLCQEKESALALSEVFFMGTKGGGAFFGKVGSFERDYEGDLLAICDQGLGPNSHLSLEQRIERIVYLSEEIEIKAKYVKGDRIF